MKRLWKTFLAYMHWSESAVCEMSVGDKDYHDFEDSEDGQPFHFGPMPCKRCGKLFII
jgi:hypothetical protein